MAKRTPDLSDVAVVVELIVSLGAYEDRDIEEQVVRYATPRDLREKSLARSVREALTRGGW